MNSTVNVFFSLSFHFSLLLAIESEIIIEPIQLILRFVEKKIGDRRRRVE